MNNRRLTSRDYKSAQRSWLGNLRWREFAAGLFLGLLVALVVYISDRRTLRADEQPAPPRSAAQPEAPVGPTPATEPTDFSFYSRLASAEVTVPERELRASAGRSGKVDKPGIYWLQVGSYRDYDEADRTRGKLARIDIAASIQRVSVDDDTWHRVRVGPIRDLGELERVRMKLTGSDYKPVVLRGVAEKP